MKKLFAVVLGGRADGCNTELHDVVFVVGENLQETYPQLVQKWFGSKKRLHIDSTLELDIVDGHEVVLSTEKPNNVSDKIFFVNFGGYDKNHFGEIHETGFYVSPTKSDALARSKLELGLMLDGSHCDDNVLVDDIIAIENVDQYYIHLIPTEKESSAKVDSHYRRLDKPESLEKTA